MNNMTTEECLLALHRLLNFDTRFDDDVRKVLDQHADTAAADAAPIVPALTDSEIALIRGTMRAAIPAAAAVTG